MNLSALRALAPITVLVGLAACTATSPAPVAGSGTPSAATSTAPAPGAAPSASSHAPPTGNAASAAPATAGAACPVSAATLQRVSGLKDTHRIDAAQIRCARRWATAGVIAVDPRMQGDGVLLFEHSAGRWKKVGEGSALECRPFGIPPEIGDEVGCRDH
ncbi:hypothetical protein Q3W71_00685 [Micromonospora sp. C28SCA-DRY-2]|uniref:hypothetical protein n=1 Tax=Micromonospora sp. C28SCA-DRY-2 TaxID=3059522 RepID=UPI00267765AD|nr:hypothetical protein [Micromonospora sp. C28SCA-DRY-2]MDO3700195.1 hypothetical protein [Micromonospora sp. C28SCA-DRY-2]